MITTAYFPNVNAFRDFGGVAPLLVQIILMLKFWFSICPEAPKAQLAERYVGFGYIAASHRLDARDLSHLKVEMSELSLTWDLGTASA